MLTSVAPENRQGSLDQNEAIGRKSRTLCIVQIHSNLLRQQIADVELVQFLSRYLGELLFLVKKRQAGRTRDSRAKVKNVAIPSSKPLHILTHIRPTTHQPHLAPKNVDH